MAAESEARAPSQASQQIAPDPASVAARARATRLPPPSRPPRIPFFASAAQPEIGWY